jgi:transposase
LNDPAPAGELSPLQPAAVITGSVKDVRRAAQSAYGGFGMNLNISKRKGGRRYLYIEKGYRDKSTGKVRHKMIKSLGYLDELEKEYEDPIAHFREVALKMTGEEKTAGRQTITISFDGQLEMETDSRKNLGYAAILKIYHELELDKFIKNRARTGKFKFNTNSIMQLLLVSRILSPGSKKKAFEEKDRYFERFDFSQDDVYRSLTHFSAVSKDLQKHLHERIVSKYGRSTKTVYYDVTNFYFETDAEDELRVRGASKEHRPNPIVQVGLAMDQDAVPIEYEMFSGNTHDSQTFRSVIGNIRKNYGTGRIIVVADMGIITGDNIYYLKGGDRKTSRNGYVFRFSVRGGTKKFKEYVLSDKGYEKTYDKDTEELVSMIKSRITAREINVTMANGKTAKKTVYEKQVVCWSRSYSDRARAERERVVKKAVDMISEPAKYSSATSHGAARYVKELAVKTDTGEVVEGKKETAFDQEKLDDDEKYDGYAAMVTSELNLTDSEIAGIYHGLWEIEESFRITKGTFEARPVYVSLADHINAHFLTCFLALVIMRILQKKTGRKYSADRIVDCLNRISCSLEEENIYLFDYRRELSDAIGNALDIDFTRKRMRLADIKKILGEVKK